MSHESAGYRRRFAPRVVAATLALMGAGLLGATARAAEPDVEMSGISGSPEEPRRHFRLRDPARLSGERATQIYDIVLPALERGYRSSGDPWASGYLPWKRFNTAPYLSATHGNHYINNYANDVAAPVYGRFENGGVHPVGSVLAKDSFSVTRSGGILLGPLFLMEKMPAGFSPVSGDWRYSVVLPNGEVLGRTGGPGARRVEYCIACHLVREANDHLYFIPTKWRVSSP